MIRKLLTLLLSALIVAVLSSACASLYFRKAAETERPEPLRLGSLRAFKNREAWYSVIFNGEKIGFGHVLISSAEEPNRFVISSESTMKLKMMGLQKEITVLEDDLVQEDGRLVDLTCITRTDGSEMKVTGKVRGDTLIVRAETQGGIETYEKKLNGPVYPVPMIDFIPPIQGLFTGATYKYHVFDGQTQSLSITTQKVMDYEISEELGVRGYKVITRFQNVVIKSWYGKDGLPELEMAFGGLIINAREEEAQAKKALLEGSLAKSDILLDFSRVRVEGSLPSPSNLRCLKVEISGIKDDRLIISDEFQKVQKTPDGVIYSMALIDLDALPLYPISTPASHDLAGFLKPTPRLQCNHPLIKEKAREIIGTAKDAVNAIKLLSSWVSETVEDELEESFTALDVLKSRRGECQAHTYLYTALARAAKIPTRVVNGLVYIEGMGFMYHTWAESYAGRWIPVDPTMNQVPADVSHIKLIYGDEPEKLNLMLIVLGKLKAKVLDYETIK